jgi:hypothetical protein
MKENKDKVVRDSLITLMNFVKEQSVSSLVEQGRIIKLNDEDLRKLSVIVEASVTNAFIKGLDSVVKAAKR